VRRLIVKWSSIAGAILVLLGLAIAIDRAYNSQGLTLPIMLQIATLISILAYFYDRKGGKG
jgi:hypothetical protein